MALTIQTGTISDMSEQLPPPTQDDKTPPQEFQQHPHSARHSIHHINNSPIIVVHPLLVDSWKWRPPYRLRRQHTNRINRRISLCKFNKQNRNNAHIFTVYPPTHNIDYGSAPEMMTATADGTHPLQQRTKKQSQI